MERNNRKAFVRIRRWDSPDDCREEFYELPSARAEIIRSLVATGNVAEARTIAEQEGKRVRPRCTIDVTVY